MPALITGLPGWMEALVIVFVALLLFGHRLPGIARSLGKGITEFRRGLKEGESEGPDSGGGGRAP